MLLSSINFKYQLEVLKTMAEKLELRRTGSKFRLRIHYALLALIIILSLAVGFVAGTKGIPGITGKIMGQNTIPQSEFNYFLDKYNKLQDDYAGCVKDAWTLQLACKLNVANKNTIINKLNSTNSTN